MLVENQIFLCRPCGTRRAGFASVGTAADHDRGGMPMSSVRGRGRSLEIAVDRPLDAAADELRVQFTERPDFYRGSRAVANLGALTPSASEIALFRDVLAEFGIGLDGVTGDDALGPVVAELGLAYL